MPPPFAVTYCGAYKSDRVPVGTNLRPHTSSLFAAHAFDVGR
jgi:hypothetical protein